MPRLREAYLGPWQQATTANLNLTWDYLNSGLLADISMLLVTLINHDKPFSLGWFLVIADPQNA